MPMAWYSAPMPRTKPAISRPRVRLSRMAYSSATISGLLRSGNARPRIASLARLTLRAGENAGNRHHAVGGLMMLVEAHAVEAELVGKLHLVEIVVIELGAFLRIVMPVRERHPGRAVLCDRIEVGVPVGHEMEIEELHAAILMAPMKASSSAAKASPFSTCGRCPQSATMTTFAPGISP